MASVCVSPAVGDPLVAGHAFAVHTTQMGAIPAQEIVFASVESMDLVAIRMWNGKSLAGVLVFLVAPRSLRSFSSGGV